MKLLKLFRFILKWFRTQVIFTLFMLCLTFFLIILILIVDAVGLTARLEDNIMNIVDHIWVICILFTLEFRFLEVGKAKK